MGDVHLTSLLLVDAWSEVRWCPSFLVATRLKIERSPTSSRVARAYSGSHFVNRLVFLTVSSFVPTPSGRFTPSRCDTLIGYRKNPPCDLQHRQELPGVFNAPLKAITVGDGVVRMA
jgi:hypothetical protein